MAFGFGRWTKRRKHSNTHYPSRLPASTKIANRFLRRIYDVMLIIKKTSENITNHIKTMTGLLPRYLLDFEVRSRSNKAAIKTINPRGKTINEECRYAATIINIGSNI